MSGGVRYEKTGSQKTARLPFRRGVGVSGVLRGADVHFIFFGEAAAVYSCRTADHSGHFPAQALKGAYIYESGSSKKPEAVRGSAQAYVRNQKRDRE